MKPIEFNEITNIKKAVHLDEDYIEYGFYKKSPIIISSRSLVKQSKIEFVDYVFDEKRNFVKFKGICLDNKKYNGVKRIVFWNSQISFFKTRLDQFPDLEELDFCVFHGSKSDMEYIIGEILSNNQKLISNTPKISLPFGIRDSYKLDIKKILSKFIPATNNIEDRKSSITSSNSKNVKNIAKKEQKNVETKEISYEDVIKILGFDTNNIQRPKNFEELQDYLIYVSESYISQFKSGKNFNDLLMRIAKSKNGLLGNIDPNDDYHNYIKKIRKRYPDKLPPADIIEISTSGPFEPVYFRFIKLSALTKDNYTIRGVYGMYGVSKMAFYNDNNNEDWIFTVSYY